MCALVVGLYYNSHLNVDQFSVEHRKHLVDIRQRVDKDKIRRLLEADDRAKAEIQEKYAHLASPSTSTGEVPAGPGQLDQESRA